MMKRVGVLAVVLALAACGSDSNTTNTGPTSVAGKTYTATLANGDALSLVFASNPNLQANPRSEAVTTIYNVTGTYTPSGATAIAITGTYDSSTGKFSVVGGNYKVEGTFSNGSLTGTVTPPTGSALTFTATAPASTTPGTSNFTGSGGSCTVTTSGTNAGCFEWNQQYAQVGTIQTACNSSCGSTSTCTYSANGCSSSGRVGRCVWTYSVSGFTYQMQTSFYSGTAAQLQDACTKASGSTQGVTTAWVAG